MERIRQRDLQELLNCVAEVYAHHDLDGFGQRVLALVPKVVSASYLAYNEFNARLTRSRYFFDTPGIDLGPQDRAWEILRQHQPLIHHYQNTGDGTAHKLSDFMSRSRYHESALYREVLCRGGVEYQMAFYLPERPPNNVAIALVRDRCDFTERDRLVLNLLRPHLFQAYHNAEIITHLRQEFAQATLALEEVAQGVVTLDAHHRIQFCTARARHWLSAYFGRVARPQGKLPDEMARWLHQQQLPATRSGTLPPPRQAFVVKRGGRQLTIRLLAGSAPGQQTLLMQERRTELSAAALRSLGLTRREAQVLLWVAQGKTNPETGIILGMSAGTVHKHTERIFQKLGVETRTAAAACAWEVLARGQD